MDILIDCLHNYTGANYDVFYFIVSQYPNRAREMFNSVVQWGADVEDCETLLEMHLEEQVNIDKCFERLN